MTAFVAALLFVTFIRFMQALRTPSRKLQIALTPHRILQTHKTTFGSQRSEEEKNTNGYEHTLFNRTQHHNVLTNFGQKNTHRRLSNNTDK